MNVLDDRALTDLLADAAGSFAVPGDGAAAVLDAASGDVPRVTSRRPLRWAAAAAVVAVAFVGGAALQGGTTDDSARQVVAAPAASGDGGPPVVQPQTGPALTDQAENGDEASPTAFSSLTKATAGSAAAPASKSVAPAAAPAAAPADTGDNRVVKTGEVSLVVDDGRVTPTLTQVQQAAASKGGIVQDGATQETGATPSGRVVLRVPVAQFDGLVAAVRGLDGEVVSASTTGKDVTAQYADVEAQVRSLTAARERFLAILEKAGNVGEVLAVQQRIDTVQGQIDRLEGQRRVLERQSDFGTLTVSVAEQEDVVAAKEERSGLSQAFVDGKDGFVDGVEALVRGAGPALLVLLCLVAFLLVARPVWRRTRRRLV